MKDLKKQIVITTSHRDNTGSFSTLKNNIRSINTPISNAVQSFKKLEYAQRDFLKKGNGKGFGKSFGVPSSSAQALPKDLGSTSSMLGISSIISTFAGVFSLSKAASFEAEFLKMKTSVKETGVSFEQLKEKANVIGRDTQFSQTDAMRSAKLLGASGWGSSQIYESLQPIVELTGAANVNDNVTLPETTSRFADFMSSYHVEQKDFKAVGNKIAYAFSNSNQTFSELMEALRVFSPIAYASGIPIENALGHVMSMSNTGIKGSIAGTSLGHLAGHIPNLTPEAVKILKNRKISEKEFGTVYNKKEGRINDLSGFFSLLQKKGVTPGEFFKVTGEDSGKSLISLYEKGIITKTNEHIKNLKDDNGVLKDLTTKLNSVNMKGFSGAITMLASSMEGLSIRVASLGFLDLATLLIRATTKCVDAISSLPESVLKPMAIGFGALTTFFTGRLVMNSVKSLMRFAKMSSLANTASTALLVSSVGQKTKLTGVGVARNFLPAIFNAGPFRSLAKPLNIFTGPIKMIWNLLKTFCMSITGWGVVIAAGVAALGYVVWFVIKNRGALKKKFPILKSIQDLLVDTFKIISNCITSVIDWLSGILKSITSLVKSGLLYVLGDSANTAGFKFNPVNDLPSLGKTEAEKTHDRFVEGAKKELERKELEKKEMSIKVHVTADKGLSVTAERKDGPIFDLPRGSYALYAL